MEKTKIDYCARAIIVEHMSDLQVMSHSRLHDLLEGVVDPPPHPAVDVDALHSKLDRLLCEVFILPGSERAREEVQKVC